ncbi:HTH myb-type domain-containing protein [Mycena sanguinolenta]|uniref:HTH myb-type domain-containing protein n=1 Tax=Mycena sanguinolenta TaxID=230812 RepID=A0A8H6XEW4_9AGAR|nr:HTH myb-type domain-containing protein [Mycena sanguinolenta]
MTSRVQKGGPIFKPVAKSRARATSTAPRQASVTPVEGRASVAPSGDASSPALASMPPPATIPVRGFDPDAFPDTNSSQPVASSSRAPPAIISSGSRISAPPVITAPKVVSQPRHTPAPPAIVSRPAAASVVHPPPLPNTHAPSPTLVNPDSVDPLLDTFQLPPQDDFHFPEDFSQFIAPSLTLVPSNPSTLVPPPESSTLDPTPENSVKKPRKRKKKETAEGDGDTNEGETSKKPKAARTKRAKKDAGETTDGGATDVEKPRKKKKRTKEAGETSDGVQPKPRKKRKPKAENADEDESPVKKKRKKSTPFDPDADPGEEIDPTVVTMAELCTDNGHGRISSKAIEIQTNHMTWKQQSKEKRARMKALAEQKKYGRPEEEDGESETVAAPLTEAAPVADDAQIIAGPGSSAGVEPVVTDASGSGFDYSQDLTRSRFTVQVRIGPNGETIIDEESLTVDREEEPDTSNYTHVVESDHTKFVNSSSYTKKCRGSRWSAEETDLFYEALAQHGENYELISLVLPGRSRTACKNKFKAEDKKDSARITRCIESRTPIDMKTLARLTGRDFSGPTPIIKAPTPPPIPEPSADTEPEPGPRHVRKRSRSRTALPSTEGVQVLGDVDEYKDD